MKNYFDINAYLNQAQSEYSGFDGSDFDGDDSNFDSNANLDLSFDGSDFDGDSNASGGGAGKQASPYQVSVVNSTAGTLTAVLFGYNIYQLTSNFGSAVGITVTPSQTNVSYLQLLSQSASQPFETSLIRIQSSNNSQITQIITINSSDANGQSCTIPLITQSYFSANQFQAGILDIPFAVRVDGNTYLSFGVLANTTVTITLFPREKANLSRNLNKQGALQNYAFPTVPVASQPVYVSPRAGGRRPAKRIG